jgi:hypothetical protein
MRTLFRPDATAFENMKNEPGRSDSGVNFVMYFDFIVIYWINFFGVLTRIAASPRTGHLFSHAPQPMHTSSRT